MTGTKTHRAIDHALCGRPLEVGGGRSRLEMEVTEAMRADEHGLAHGGFTFGLADHAAMLAVDEPTVVLAAAEVQLTAPVRVGDRLTATAEVEWSEGRERRVRATVRRAEGGTGGEGEPVLTGSFRCYVPARHVLEPRDR
ncbi:MAG TPA: hotdog domain-containing protein [Thermoanaerobaculia bacterium]|nr:hotdog domain-containing protein [Thermoanaerobaculia bacterium]